MTLEAPVLMQPTGGDPDIDYSAQQLRTIADALLAREGVFGGTHLAVSQRGAGANFSVDVAAGMCAIFGDDVSNQGKYVQRNTAVLNVAGTWAAPVSGTRVKRAEVRPMTTERTALEMANPTWPTMAASNSRTPASRFGFFAAFISFSTKGWQRTAP